MRYRTSRSAITTIEAAVRSTTGFAVVTSALAVKSTVTRVNPYLRVSERIPSNRDMVWRHSFHSSPRSGADFGMTPTACSSTPRGVQTPICSPPLTLALSPGGEEIPRLEQAGQPAAQRLGARRLPVSRQQPRHRLCSLTMHFVDALASRLDRLADIDADLLPQPHVLGTGQPDWDHRNPGVHREMGEALLEGKDLTFARPKVPLWEQRQRALELEAAPDLLKEIGGLAARPVHGDDAARGANQRPLQAPSHHSGRVGQEVDARLDRKDHRESQSIQPPEVVGDDDVCAGARYALTPVNGEAEGETQRGHGDQADDAIGERGAAPHREQIDWRDLRAGLARGDRFRVGSPPQCIPAVRHRYLRHGDQAGAVQHSPAVVAAEVRAGPVRRLGISHPQNSA